MTFTASLATTEAAARGLVDAIGDSEALGTPSVGMTETAPGLWQFTAYFEARPKRATLDAIARSVLGKRAPDWSFADLPEIDWITKSLEGLKPVRVGRFLIHGRHDRTARRANDVAIEIEAGQAFGTGHHGTTAGCLAAIAELGRARRFRNILDLGTGSGVLAIAIAKAWKVPVLASDIDPLAVAIAAENARLNGVSAYVETVTAAGFRHPAFARSAPFDLIVANILAGPLAIMSPALARHLAHGGSAILSGLLPEQQARITAAYRGQGLRLGRAAVRDNWLTLTLHRP